MVNYILVYTCRNHGYEQYWDGCRWVDTIEEAKGYTEHEAHVWRLALCLMRNHFTCKQYISIKKGD